MILILVLVVIAILSLGAFTFSELMLVERKAAHLAGRQVQARELAESGVDMARMFLAWDEESQYEGGGWYDNGERFRGVLVVDGEQARDRGRFTFVAPYVEDGYYNGIRYGLEDESTRLNLNALTLFEKLAEKAGMENGGRQILMGLPGMTEEIADAILDWIDTDDEIREYGAELEYYTQLDPPYAPKNGPLETVEELLLVRDVTPWLLFGVDANRNGQADQGEPDSATVGGMDNSDGSLTRGWAAYLTLHSLETNLRPDGEPKVYLNQEDMETLYNELEEVLDPQWATFIVAYRQYGPAETEEPGEASYGVDVLDLSQPGKVKINQVLDLVGKKVEVKGAEGGGEEGGGEAGGGEGGSGGSEEGESMILETPFPDTLGLTVTYLPTLMDYVTATESTLLPARLNINQAPRTLIAGVPGMTPEILEEIITRRQTDPGAAEAYRRHETWLYCDGIVTLDEMQMLTPFITAGGSVYRAQVIGYFDEEGPSARIEVVFDATTSPARVISWRDLSHLGRGYSLDTLGTEAPDW
jgi:hypothetical protein